MKALVYTGIKEMVVRDEPAPVAGQWGAILRVEAAGICGSDMRGYHGTDAMRAPPLIMGHEVAGRVVDGTFAGRRAIVNPMITCGRCEDCLSGRSNLCQNRYAIGVQKPGGFAEFVAVPEHNLIEVPEDMNPVHAVLAEPAATCLRVVVLANKAALRPLAEGRSLVLGGGAIGLLSALWLRSFGVRDIVLSEVNPLRRETATRAGLNGVHPDEVEPNSFDLIVDAVGGGETRRLAIAAARRGAVIVHVGLKDNAGELDMRKLTMGEITLLGSYTYQTRDLLESVRALYSGALGSLDWIDERTLSEGPAAFAALSQGNTGAAKIVLRPQG